MIKINLTNEEVSFRLSDMKQIKTINVLCGLIILIMAVQVCIPIYKFSVAFGYGFSAGIEAGLEDNNADTVQMETLVPVDITFSPTKNSYITPPDSLVFADGRSYQMLLKSAVVMVPVSGNSMFYYVCGIILSLSTIVVVIMVIVAFLNFLVSINRGFIFDSANVRRLARIGWLLLIASLLEIMAGLTRIFITDLTGFKSELYNLSSSWTLPFSDAMFGLFALMLAAIWRRGLEMQNEQALTV